MKRIIDIPNELAEKEHWYTDKEIWTVVKAVQNGTPIPDNAAVCDIERIRAEIEALPRELPTDARNMVRRTRVLDIIDKYTAESEE